MFVRQAWMMDHGHVMCEMDGRSGYSLRVYDVRTLEPTADYLHYGNGPQEVLMPTVAVTDGNVYVRDGNKQKLYVIPAAAAGTGAEVGDYRISGRLSYLGTSHEGSDLRGKSAGGQSLLLGEHGSWYQSGITETDFPGCEY